MLKIVLCFVLYYYRIIFFYYVFPYICIYFKMLRKLILATNETQYLESRETEIQLYGINNVLGDLEF